MSDQNKIIRDLDKELEYLYNEGHRVTKIRLGFLSYQALVRALPLHFRGYRVELAHGIVDADYMAFDVEPLDVPQLPVSTEDSVE